MISHLWYHLDVQAQPFYLVVSNSVELECLINLYHRMVHFEASRMVRLHRRAHHHLVLVNRLLSSHRQGHR